MNGVCKLPKYSKTMHKILTMTITDRLWYRTCNKQYKISMQIYVQMGMHNRIENMKTYYSV